MKRIAVFVFFDKSGIVDRYINIMLDGLKNYFQKLIIIINGNITDEGLKQLKRYTSDIYFRKNEGYDACAYKDALTKFISIRELNNYDELLLFNDTFYGPFYSLNNIFKIFEEEYTDFWGLTRHPEGNLGEGREFKSHIQAYFLTVRKKLFISSDFMEFWQSLEYPATYYDAIENFEIKFTSFFESKGYIGKTLFDIYNNIIDLKKGVNPYIFYSYELIKNMGMPFIKRKSLRIESLGYINAMDALAYIEEHLGYNLESIWEHEFRLHKENPKTYIFNYNVLEEFYNSHDKIYIYGAGIYGKNIQRYFQYRCWRFEGFLVSDNNGNMEDTKINKYGDVVIGKKDGVILALKKAYLEEVLLNIEKDLCKEQIFFPVYN